MPLQLVRNDIVKMKADAIVNAANEQLRPGGGVCGAIFAAAGHDSLEAACRAIGHCPTGSAVVTPAFGLGAKYIIHAVGPRWQGGRAGEAELLRGCYLSALTLAKDKGCKSVAFPLISAGIYGYPKARALRVAMDAISAFLLEEEMQVYLVIFDADATMLGEKLLGSIRQYIDDVYVEHSPFLRRRAVEENMLYGAAMDAMPAPMAPPAPKETKAAKFAARRSLDDVLSQLEESFSRHLLRLIDESGMTDVEVYKRANLDRKLFSKIRKDNGYTPSKPTAIALAVALRLNLDQTRDLLARAGYALSHSSRFDVIVEYFIREGVYDIMKINETLFLLGERTLGAA